MAKKYLSRVNGTSHTYKFYKDRRDDPRWVEDFLDVRAIRRRNTIIGLLIVVVILCIGTIFAMQSGMLNSKKNEAKTEEFVAKKPSTNEKTDKPIQKKENKEENDKIAVQRFLERGFMIKIVSYNGEDPDSAMEDGSAPQNLIHDGWTSGYVKDANTVRTAHINSAADQKYSLENGYFIIKYYASQTKFKYRVMNNTVTFDNLNVKDGDTTVIYELVADSSAKESIDSMPMQN